MRYQVPAAIDAQLACGRTLVCNLSRAVVGAARRRRPDRLTARQRDLLAPWGYPYVLDESRPLFTLTGQLASSEPAFSGLRQAFGASVSDPGAPVNALALFVHDDGADFLAGRRFPLGRSSAK